MPDDLRVETEAFSPWKNVEPLLRIGIERPKGYRHQWERKACFRNAALIPMSKGFDLPSFTVQRATCSVFATPGSRSTVNVQSTKHYLMHKSAGPSVSSSRLSAEQAVCAPQRARCCAAGRRQDRNHDEGQMARVRWFHETSLPVSGRKLTRVSISRTGSIRLR